MESFTFKHYLLIWNKNLFLNHPSILTTQADRLKKNKIQNEFKPNSKLGIIQDIAILKFRHYHKVIKHWLNV